MTVDPTKGSMFFAGSLLSQIGFNVVQDFDLSLGVVEASSEDIWDTVRLWTTGRWLSGLHVFPVVTVLACCFFVLRFFVLGCCRSHAESVVTHDDNGNASLAAITDASERTKLENSKEKLVSKYLKYIWHGSVYVVFLLWGVRILYLAPWCAFLKQNWSWDAATLSVGYPHVSDVTEQKDLMIEVHWFLVVQLAWYVHGFFENLIYDRSRGDFVMMMIHHVVAASLVYGAYISDAHRIGVHVTFTMDIADVILYYCKGFHLRTSDYYGKPKSDRRAKEQTGKIIVVCSAWLVFRVVVFGWEILGMWQNNSFATNSFTSNYLKLLLMLLWGLQFVWWIYACKILAAQLLEGSFHDAVHGDYADNRDEAVKVKEVRATSYFRQIIFCLTGLNLTSTSNKDVCANKPDDAVPNSEAAKKKQ